MDAAQSWLPALMARVEARLAALVEGHGQTLADDARATLEAGGKRLRPMLVLLCAGPGAADGALRAAAAIELVHMATLVHDDVLDAAPLRRGLPTVVATSGRDRAMAVGDLLLSRAFAELGESNTGGAERQVRLLARASVGLALGELAQRRDAFDLGISEERYRERCLLKTARLFECACLIGRAGADPDPGRRGAHRLRPRDRARLPAPRRRPRRRRPARAHGQGARNRPPRRHGHAAADPGPRARPGARPARPARARRRRAPRRRATGSPRRARWRRSAPTPGRGWTRRSGSSPAAPGLDDGQRRLLALVADGVVERYA